MLQGRTPRVFGDGLQTRDFTYVGDVVQALTKAADTPGIAGRTYNVGTGRGTNLLELVEALNQLLGTNVKAEHGPPRSGDIRYSRRTSALSAAIWVTSRPSPLRRASGEPSVGIAIRPDVPDAFGSKGGNATRKVFYSQGDGGAWT